MVMLGLMWVLLIRPQRRRQVQQSSMLERLAAGDEIVTAGGLYGTIRGIGEEDLTVEIAPGTTVRIAKRAIAAVLPPEDEEIDADSAEELGQDAEDVDARALERSPRRTDSAGASPS